MNNPSLYTYQFFDASSTNARRKGFSGAENDGSYIYYAPLSNEKGVFHGTVVRYNSNLDFDDELAWSEVDITQWNKHAKGFVDVLFDGNYMYFIPFHNEAHHGVVARYEVGKDFFDSLSWSFVDLENLLHPKAKGFVSGSFDGRYIHLSAYQESWTQHNGTMVRYDTHAPFEQVKSWQYFNTESLWPRSRGFHGAISTKKYTYFIPYVRENRDYHGLLLRHRNGTDFGDPTNWSSIDLTQIHPLAKGFVGGVFDQHHIYLSPYFNGLERHGLVLRVSVDKDVLDPNHWECFDMTSLHKDNRGYFGAIADGHIIHFIPHCKEEGIYHGRLASYDTRLDFQDPNAWSTYDTALKDPKSMGYMGGTLLHDSLFLAPYEIASFDHSGLMLRIGLNPSSK